MFVQYRYCVHVRVLSANARAYALVEKPGLNQYVCLVCVRVYVCAFNEKTKVQNVEENCRQCGVRVCVLIGKKLAQKLGRYLQIGVLYLCANLNCSLLTYVRICFSFFFFFPFFSSLFLSFRALLNGDPLKKSSKSIVLYTLTTKFQDLRSSNQR